DSLYNALFKGLAITLAAVGLILTPVYLLDLLRRVFYGAPGAVVWAGGDANPRELFIALSLLIPVLVVGTYPRSLSDWSNPATTLIAEQWPAPATVVAQPLTVPPVLFSTVHQ
ncbi:MAG: hypothetical protein Q6K81_07460, partial [Gloeomargarita sp. DG02_5_bins_242]